MRLTEHMIIARSKESDLSAIKRINLWGCDLSDISIVKQMTNIEVLALSVNNLNCLQPLESCTKLQELYLRKNNIQDFKQLVHLSKLPSLSHLALAENPCCVSAGANYRACVVKLLPSLKTLDDNPITVEDVEQAKKLEQLGSEPTAFEQPQQSTKDKAPQRLSPSQILPDVQHMRSLQQSPRDEQLDDMPPEQLQSLNQPPSHYPRQPCQAPLLLPQVDQQLEPHFESPIDETQVQHFQNMQSSKYDVQSNQGLQLERSASSSVIEQTLQYQETPQSHQLQLPRQRQLSPGMQQSQQVPLQHETQRPNLNHQSQQSLLRQKTNLEDQQRWQDTCGNEGNEIDFASNGSINFSMQKINEYPEWAHRQQTKQRNPTFQQKNHFKQEMHHGGPDELHDGDTISNITARGDIGNCWQGSYCAQKKRASHLSISSMERISGMNNSGAPQELDLDLMIKDGRELSSARHSEPSHRVRAWDNLRAPPPSYSTLSNDEPAPEFINRNWITEKPQQQHHTLSSDTVIVSRPNRTRLSQPSGHSVSIDDAANTGRSRASTAYNVDNLWEDGSHTNRSSASQVYNRGSSATLSTRNLRRRNENVLSALLCIVPELDLESLQVLEHSIKCRMDELNLD